MNFRTQVELPKRETEIRHSDRIMLFGSCFAENIGNLLLANKFRCDVNPFGILYNPLSIVEALWQILSHQTYTEEDLFYAGCRAVCGNFLPPWSFLSANKQKQSPK